MSSQIIVQNGSLQINSDWLLLVEGKDEINLFKALLKHCYGDNAKVQVIDTEGKSNFRRKISAINTAIRKKPTIKSIGVVRDADNSAGSALRSVCDALRYAKFDAPVKHGEFTEGTPAIGVFIVPDGSMVGAIETLCRHSIKNADAIQCVEDYLQCMKQANALHSNNKDKSFAHAYLASWKDPMARVGEGALQGAWDFNAPAFEPLIQFLRKLVSKT